MSLRKYENIVNMLRIFAKTGDYAIIDRIANALTARAVESALYDALRLANTLVRQAEEVTLIGGRRIRVIEYAREDERRFKTLILAREGEIMEDEGKVKIRYVEAPTVETLPDAAQIEKFLSEVRSGFKGLSTAKEVAMKALTPDP